MAKSAKAKKEKKKDFQKPKFKVGKAKPKADNFTNTSFKSKSVSVLQQNLSAAVPSDSAQILHHLSLLNHKSDSQRRDSLSYLTKAFHDAPQPPLAISAVLPKAQPVILDASGTVRAQLLKLLAEFDPADLRPHAETTLLYIRAAMTHLSVSIRVTGVELLDLLLDKVGTDIVTLGGGWVKTLKVFMTLLRWTEDQDKVAARSAVIPVPGGWKASSVTAGKSTEEVKCLSKTLRCLGRFLETGLVESKDPTAAELEDARQAFPLYRTQAYLIPTKSNPFRHLNLFGAPKDQEDRAYDNAPDRRKIFEDMFGTTIRQGLEKMKKEGGTLGREAGETNRLLDKISEGSGTVEVRENYMVRMKRVAYEKVMAESSGR